MQLPVINPKTPFQNHYQPAIKSLVAYLTAGLGDNLHSIYVYGSVARKTARPEYSNLDIVVVCHQPFDDRKTTVFNTLRWRFQKSFPFITDIDIKSALVSEVASLDSLFSWGFLLRHCAVCIYGENLSECFGNYETSWEIAKYWNMDIEERIVYFRDRLAKAGQESEQMKIQTMLAKKLLRASYGLIMYKDKWWFDDPVECGQHFLKYHPEKEQDVARLSILLRQKVIPKRSVIGLLDDYGPWLAKQYKKTEFRIG
ncbi:hypothetical protein VA7868_04312 [Vibrio aerogenes CECT 7868]|uniref:Polymerase nucleotidyl transferase domain-containing protein n=1 Tax=Vibrio aerogenes CECT 7868 TaxID=1216006 RepID=A0A1M6DTA3_9VIBR|nr:nucleotidyltransferase domain-containing protein [Vibrio aerogenes]SHI76393.1 hypothetical protein VA7868_04312 [Vibrio aerogenes CECT 7868]